MRAIARMESGKVAPVSVKRETKSDRVCEHTHTHIRCPVQRVQLQTDQAHIHTHTHTRAHTHVKAQGAHIHMVPGVGVQQEGFL